jgi:hypothetical protein
VRIVGVVPSTFSYVCSAPASTVRQLRAGANTHRSCRSGLFKSADDRKRP